MFRIVIAILAAENVRHSYLLGVNFIQIRVRAELFIEGEHFASPALSLELLVKLFFSSLPLFFPASFDCCFFAMTFASFVFAIFNRGSFASLLVG